MFFFFSGAAPETQIKFLCQFRKYVNLTARICSSGF